MSLFDTLLGNSSTANTSGNNTSNEQQQQSQNTTGSQVAAGQTTTAGGQTTTSGQKQDTSQVASGSGFTNSLDPKTVALVTSLIGGLAAGGGGGAQISDIAQQFLSAAATPAISASDVAGKQSAAVTNFNQNEAVDIGKLTNAIGSKNNTYSALVGQKGQQDLSATLAGITADAASTNAQIKDQQLSAAVNALVQGQNVPIGNIAALLSVLKGANTTTGTTEATTGSNITNILEQLTSGQTVNTNSTLDTSQNQDTIANLTGATTSNTSGKQGSGLLGLIF